jgi:regulator of sigma E protease
MLSTVLYYLSTLILIGVLVLIHEFGHYVVARSLGVGVRVFSIGFGPRLFGVVHGGTDYRISAVPLGGYVRMAGGDPFAEGGVDDEDVQEAVNGFMSKPAWARLAISLAGPACNIVLPFVVFTALFAWGEPQSEAILAAVRPNSPAAQAGILVDDRVTSLNGTPVETWVDMIEVLETMPQGELKVGLQRQGQALDVVVKGEGVDVTDPAALGLGNFAPSTRILVDDPTSPAGKAGLKSGLMITEVNGTPVRTWTDLRREALSAERVELAWYEGDPNLRPDGTVLPPEGAQIQRTVLSADSAWTDGTSVEEEALWRRWGLASASLGVVEVEKGSAADRAGIQAGDHLLVIDGTRLVSWGDVLRLVAASGTGQGESQTARTVEIQLRRAGQLINLSVLPDVVKDTDLTGSYYWRPRLGMVGSGESIVPLKIVRSYPLPVAARRAAEQTIGMTRFLAEHVGKLVTGEAALQKSLGGPIEIFRQTAAAAEQGLFYWAKHMAMFSISLAVLNMLPVPVLDGGQALMYLLEWIRGRPLSVRLRELALQAGVVFMAIIFVMVFVFDIHRMIVD